jgi:hypothetical protein
MCTSRVDTMPDMRGMVADAARASKGGVGPRELAA